SATPSTAQSQSPQLPLAQLQIPQTSGVIAPPPASTAKASSVPAPQRTELTQAGTGLGSAALADEPPFNLPAILQDMSGGLPATQSATTQNEAAPAVLAPEAETNAIDGSNVGAVADSEAGSGTPGGSTPATAARANSPATPRPQEPAPGDEEQKHPVLDALA